MKKLILIGVAIGTLNLAQATSITILSAGSEISGPYSYLYNETVSPLTPGSTISSATLSFSDIELTASGPANIPNTLFYDLINGNFATKTIDSGETKTDYFQNNSPYDGKGISDALGSKTLSLDDTTSWTYTFSGQALTDLQNDIAKGVFDIGLDPNCIYDIKGSIDLDYTTTPNGNIVSAPDATMTAGLLGVSFLGLIGFRRKFAV